MPTMEYLLFLANRCNTFEMEIHCGHRTVWNSHAETRQCHALNVLNMFLWLLLNTGAKCTCVKNMDFVHLSAQCWIATYIQWMRLICLSAHLFYIHCLVSLLSPVQVILSCCCVVMCSRAVATWQGHWDWSVPCLVAKQPTAIVTPEQQLRVDKITWNLGCMPLHSVECATPCLIVHRNAIQHVTWDVCPSAPLNQNLAVFLHSWFCFYSFEKAYYG